MNWSCMTVLRNCSKRRCLISSTRALKLTITTDKNAIRDADVCIFSAGLPRNPSVKTRADLLEANLPQSTNALRCSKDSMGS